MDNTAKTQTAVDDLIAAVNDETTVVDSAITAFSGIEQKLADAIASASNAGATDAQLASLSGLKDAINAEKQKLADAVANVPA